MVDTVDVTAVDTADGTAGDTVVDTVDVTAEGTAVDTVDGTAGDTVVDTVDVTAEGTAVDTVDVPAEGTAVDTVDGPAHFTAKMSFGPSPTGGARSSPAGISEPARFASESFRGPPPYKEFPALCLEGLAELLGVPVGLDAVGVSAEGVAVGSVDGAA